MTNTERIQTNNAELRECIELAESLPDAGTNVEVILQSKTVTPTKDIQNVTADADYTALEQVTVEAIPDGYISTDDANATAADMRKGKTAYVDGIKITGSIEEFDGSYECSGESTGGGEVNIETCTVTVENYLTNAYANDEYRRTFAYTDGSLNGVLSVLPYQDDDDSGWGMEPLMHTFTVAKGTVICAPMGIGMGGNKDVLTPIRTDAGYVPAVIVNGDCTINIG